MAQISVFYYDINKLLNKINKYWYADKAPNQSVRILRALLKQHYLKRTAPLPEKREDLESLVIKKK